MNAKVDLQPVTLTPKAAEHVRNFLAKRGKGFGLRLGRAVAPETGA